VLGFNPGIAANNQAQNGIPYNSTTGVITVTAPIVPPISVGTPVELVSVTVSQGFNYLNTFFTATGAASGNTFQVTTSAGYPGLNVSAAPGAKLTTSSSVQLNCYGNNLY
jgi:hypothetical protein